MEQERTFFYLHDHKDKLEPGTSLTIERRIQFNAWYAKEPMTPLVKLPHDEIEKRIEQSEKKEEAIFEKLRAATKDWSEQASQTLLLKRSMEYLNTVEVSHTGNEWKQKTNGVWEISNRVYVMRYTIQEIMEGDKKGQWLIQWGIGINKPKHPPSDQYYYPGETMVVETKKKYYNAQADAQNYIQGRFDVYAYLFEEISPPIPSQYERHFKINGYLLPGYTVAEPEQPPEKVAESLLEFLSTEDCPSEPTQETEQKADPAKEKKHHHNKGKNAPVR